MNSELAIIALSALAQEHRLATFRLLVQAGPEGLPAGQIAARLGIPASSLSFHLGHLVESGLASQQRQGRSLVYSANYAAMSGLMTFLTENCCGGETCDGASATISCEVTGA